MLGRKSPRGFSPTGRTAQGNGRPRTPRSSATAPKLSCGDNHSNGEYNAEFLQVSITLDTRRLSRAMPGGARASAWASMTSALQLAQFSHIENTAKALKAKTLVPSENLIEHIITVIRCKRERSIIRHSCEMIREPPRCGR